MDRCDQCGKEYKRVAQHWSTGSCDYPSFSTHQREIITGTLMSDACLNRSDSRNPQLKLSMITPQYLEFIDNEFGVFGNGVRHYRTAEELAEANRKNGFSPNAKSENYNDLYRWHSMTHPELDDFSSWYDSGSKVWPEDITLTPTVLKHLYCGDGHWSNTHGNNCIIISMHNECGNVKKINKMFKSSGLPSPSYTPDSNWKARFTVEESRELWEYMGSPLPGFEYKWPEEYR